MLDWRDFLRHLDYILVIATAGLVTFGVTMIYYATRHDVPGQPMYYVKQQLIAVAVGVVGLVVISFIDYEVYRRYQWLLYGIAIVALGIVPFIGTDVLGARRWIDLGFTSVQPSALALLLLALSIGGFLADRLDLLGSKLVTIIALALAALPAAIVYLGPDFGSAMVLLSLVLAMLFFYGTPWTHFAVLFGTMTAVLVLVLKVLPMAGIHLIKAFQVERLLVFLNPGSHATGSGYNVIQSMIAVGSGALTGRGNMATQTGLDFLPEHHTDFIFATIGERDGFVGAAILLLLFTLFIWRALRIATLSRDMYGSILAGGFAVMLLFEVFVNMGMTIGIMPVTGIPLPFISYGGTAMITFLLFVGLLQAVHLRGTVTPSTRGRFVD